MNKNLPTAFLKPHREETLLRFHPWIFSGAIARIQGDVQEGEILQVADNQGKILAKGHYQIGSIAVRILTFSPEENIDENFFLSRIEQTYKVRENLGLCTDFERNNSFRLVHGEGDNLSGLIVDVYAQTAVIQAHTVGMHNARFLIADAILKVVKQVKNIYYKSESTLPFKAKIEVEDGYLVGSQDDCQALENGLRFQADWLKGQKTGFFLDQRDNRALLEKYARGRDVLNMFCYTGGFSFYALRGGAKSVCSIDSSAKAIELTEQNVALNFPNALNHIALAEDAFKFLENIKDKYDLIILDPPAFAKHKNVLKNALSGYRRLNAKAFAQIRKGGILFTFSCSQVVSREDFRLAVMSAAAQSGRTVRILHQLTQPADHPINIFHPESEYLKGLVLQVD